MDVAFLLRTARSRTGWSLRELARRAGTSYSTLSDYERGTKVPSLQTLTRLIESAGFALEVSLVDAAVPTRGDRDNRPRGVQLVEVLDLADHFPSRRARNLRYPILRSQMKSRTS